jgi:hypothetical protein
LKSRIASRGFERDGTNSALIPEERRASDVSKDGDGTELPCFETPRFARLLSMRTERVGRATQAGNPIVHMVNAANGDQFVARLR